MWRALPSNVLASSTAYRPRAGPAAVLHAVVRDHLEEFLQAARAHGDGTGVPAFVETELRRFLTCGVLAHGFTRVRCDGCGFERFVPFACKGRGFCPSCGGRRMAERAAHLTDRVLPAVPLRQWVLTVPHRLRYLMAWDHPASAAPCSGSTCACCSAGTAGGAGAAASRIRAPGR